MKTSIAKRLFLLSAFALAAPASAAAGVGHTHRHRPTAPRGFAGTYQVEIKTTSGRGVCAPSYSGTVTIRNFRIVASSDSQATASGGIEDDGTVSLALHKDGQIANVGGQIHGRRGHGFWSSPTAYCGGLWSAERK